MMSVLFRKRWSSSHGRPPIEVLTLMRSLKKNSHCAQSFGVLPLFQWQRDLGPLIFALSLLQNLGLLCKIFNLEFCLPSKVNSWMLERLNSTKVLVRRVTFCRDVLPINIIRLFLGDIILEILFWRYYLILFP